MSQVVVLERFFFFGSCFFSGFFLLVLCGGCLGFFQDVSLFLGKVIHKSEERKGSMVFVSLYFEVIISPTPDII